MALSGSDAALYREALDGIEPDFPQLVDPPGISSMVLRISWSRASALRSFPPVAFVSSVHRNMLVLYVGPYRPGFSSRGFYLVYDARENAVAVIPRLPFHSVTMFSHCGMGSGVVVLCCSEPSQYLLAELLLRKDDRGLTSNMATLFRWWSSSSDQWVETEVVLPLPYEPDEHTSKVNYSFYIDTFFAIGSTCLCWVDLLQGMLVCDVLADCPEFRFVPLPEGCSIQIDPCEDRGLPEQYRSMTSVERGNDQIVTFVSMDGYGQGRHIGNVELTTWTLKNPSNQNANWIEGAASFGIRDLWSNRFYKDNLLLGQLTPTFPVPSMLQDNVVYIVVDHNLLQLVDSSEMDVLIERHILCLDLQRQKILSAFKTPPGTRVAPQLSIITSNFTVYLSKGGELKSEVIMSYENDRREEKCVKSTPYSEKYCEEDKCLMFTRYSRECWKEKCVMSAPSSETPQHTLSRQPFTPRSIISEERVGLASLLLDEEP